MTKTEAAATERAISSASMVADESRAVSRLARPHGPKTPTTRHAPPAGRRGPREASRRLPQTTPAADHPAVSTRPTIRPLRERR